jgi:endonuclease/exonuclease/phosphatase family metal-dependent hydrolase
MTDRKRKLGFFGGIILILNLLAIAALLLAYLAVHVSPVKNWVLPFFGLIFPYLLIFNLGFVIYWSLRLRFYFLLSLVAILLGWNHAGRIYRFNAGPLLPSGTAAVKVISYNVKNLSNDNVNLVDPSIRGRIIAYLERTRPDILCLQEFKVVHPDPDAFIDSLSVRFNLPFHAYTRYAVNQKKGLDAVFVFSRFPIHSMQPLQKDEAHSFGLFCDIEWGQGITRLFNVHLESVRFRHEDYSFLSGLDLHFEEDENLKEGSVRIFRKLRTAYAVRADQVEKITGLIQASPYPVILCGDFNDTPNSYTYQQLTARLSDAFIESGSGFGNTYAGKLPSFRIDYILHDPGFRSWEFVRERIELSDHYPVSCLIGRSNAGSEGSDLK